MSSDGCEVLLRPWGKLPSAVPDVPLHAQIREHFRKLIVQGLVNADEQLPSESELAQVFGVSRMTVRQAIIPLVAEGLLRRVRGRGTYVTHPRLEASLSSLRSFSEEMTARGSVVTSSLLLAREEVPDDTVAEFLRLQTRDRVAHLQRLRFVDSEPTSVQDHYIPHNVAPALVADSASGLPSLYEYLESHQVKLARAWQRLSASVAAPSVARLLQARPGSPVLVQERVAVGPDNSPVEFSHVIFRADRYACNVELVR